MCQCFRVPAVTGISYIVCIYIYSVTLNKELRAKARYMLEKERERETTPSACARVPRVTWGVMVFVVH